MVRWKLYVLLAMCTLLIIVDGVKFKTPRQQHTLPKHRVRASGNLVSSETYGKLGADAQLDALNEFYRATGGKHWRVRTGWDSPLNFDYCGAHGKKIPWYGIYCSGTDVVLLNLPNNLLSGTLPSAIAALTRLETLDISHNSLSGSIPGEGVISNLTAISLLNFANNSLSGQLPTDIGKLTSLHTLNLASNKFTGTLPEISGHAEPDITTYNVQHNRITGTVPASFAKLVFLSELYLNDNLLSGHLTKELSQLDRLETLMLANNAFAGPIPDAFAHLYSLSSFDVSHNHLNGTLPDLSNLPLQRFIANSNFLEGEVPDWAACVPNVECDASGNTKLKCQRGCYGNHCKVHACDNCIMRMCNTSEMCVTSTNDCPHCVDMWCSSDPPPDSGASTTGDVSGGGKDWFKEQDTLMLGIGGGVLFCCVLAAVDVTYRRRRRATQAYYVSIPEGPSRSAGATEPLHIQASVQQEAGPYRGSTPSNGGVPRLGSARYSAVVHSSRGTPTSARGSGWMQSPRIASPGARSIVVGSRGAAAGGQPGARPGSARPTGGERRGNVDSKRSRPASAGDVPSTTGFHDANGGVEPGNRYDDITYTGKTMGTTFQTASARTFSVVLNDDEKIVVEQGADGTKFSVNRKSNGQEVQSFTFVIDSKLEIVKWSELVFMEQIGRGGFGVVRRARRGHTDVAVKVLRNVMSPEQVQDFVEEASVLSDLKHPNCVLCMGVCVEPDHMSIITEYMPGGDLHTLIYGSDNTLLSAERGPRRLTWERKLNILYDAALGLEYLHARGIPHRDIKLRNILLDNRTPQSVKLADFGLSGLKASDIGGGGTERYAPPEVLRGDVASKASDIFSFGIVIYEVLASDRPKQDLHTAPLPPEWPPAIAQLIRACTNPDPSERPSIGAVLERLEEYAHVPGTPGTDSSFSRVQSMDQFPMLATPNVEYLGALPTDSPSRHGRSATHKRDKVPKKS